MLKTGLKKYALKDESGAIVAEIRFNPADPAIVTRFSEAGNKIKEMTDTVDITEEPEMLNRFNDEIKKLFDYALTGNKSSTANSDELFKYLAPTAEIGDGEYYFEAVYNEIKDIVEPSITAAAKASEQRVNAYTAKYKDKYSEPVVNSND